MIQDEYKDTILKTIKFYVVNNFGDIFSEISVIYKEDFEKYIPENQYISEWENKGKPLVLSCINQKDNCLILKDYGYGYYFVFDIDSEKILQKGDAYHPIFWEKNKVGNGNKLYVFFSEYFGYGKEGKIFINYER